MSGEPGFSLYQSSAKLYPRAARGRYARLRVAAMFALLGFYYAAPWLTVGGQPLLLFDLPHRRFYVFGLTLVPQDLYLLTWLLLVAALTLFFFTNLAGRLWCGYACPQTVWTEACLWIEHFTEGDRHARMKLDRAPWTARKIARKGAKHLLWAGFALYTGLSFVAYFVPARELFPAALSMNLSGWPLFWTLFYGLATWGNAGFLREQVCKYMCPYARFQSAMYDADTLIISYDRQRGEPRKLVARKIARQTAGDCVDCTLCVQVCPVGIDIREGLQYECIACAACVDVCNEVMDSVGKPRGLVRYTSERREIEDRFRLLRPRALGYGALWAAAMAGFMIAVQVRVPLEFDVIRDRHTLFRELPDERIENLYTLKLANEDSAAHRFALRATLPDGRRLTVEPDRIGLAAGESRALTVAVRAPEDWVPGIAHATFTFEAEDAPRLHRSRAASFLGKEAEHER